MAGRRGGGRQREGVGGGREKGWGAAERRGGGGGGREKGWGEGLAGRRGGGGGGRGGGGGGREKGWEGEAGRRGGSGRQGEGVGGDREKGWEWVAGRRGGSGSARSDIEWWQQYCAQWNGTAMMSVVNRAEPDFKVSMVSDASGSWGCGALHGQNWFQLKWEGLGESSQ